MITLSGDLLLSQPAGGWNVSEVLACLAIADTHGGPRSATEGRRTGGPQIPRLCGHTRWIVHLLPDQAYGRSTPAFSELLLRLLSVSSSGFLTSHKTDSDTRRYRYGLRCFLLGQLAIAHDLIHVLRCSLRSDVTDDLLVTVKPVDPT